MTSLHLARYVNHVFSFLCSRVIWRVCRPGVGGEAVGFFGAGAAPGGDTVGPDEGTMEGGATPGGEGCTSGPSAGGVGMTGRGP